MSLFRWWKRQCELAAIAVTLQAENERLWAENMRLESALKQIAHGAKSATDGLPVTVLTGRQRPNLRTREDMPPSPANMPAEVR